MIDRVDNDPALLAEDLRNLRTINRFFGGISAVRQALVPFFELIPRAKNIEILDLATGSADHPIEITKLARKLGRKVHIHAIDKNPKILKVARERVDDFKEISIESKDLLNLDYPARHFDIVLCSLAIHHFSREEGVRILGEMHRLSRVGFIVNDLNRSLVGAWTAWLYTHLTSRNPLTLHDSYVSVLRAYTPAELQAMAMEAGIRNFQIITKPFFRLLLIGKS